MNQRRRSWSHLPVIPVSEIVLNASKQPVLGRLHFGKAYGKPVAVEPLVGGGGAAADQEAFRKEVELLAALHHPNVIQFKGILLEPLSKVTEMCPGGSLLEFLRPPPPPRAAAAAGEARRRALDGISQRSFMTRKEIKTWAQRVELVRGIAEGLRYLHSKQPPVVHGNLKSANVLLRKDHTPVLANFGVERHTALNLADKLNPGWLAPEVALGKDKPTLKSDVYSFAIIMWEVLMGDRPWMGIHPLAIYHELDCGRRPPLPNEIPKEWPAVTEYLHLMECCWAQDPLDRPSFDEIVEKLVEICWQVRPDNSVFCCPQFKCPIQRMSGRLSGISPSGCLKWLKQRVPIGGASFLQKSSKKLLASCRSRHGQLDQHINPIKDDHEDHMIHHAPPPEHEASSDAKSRTEDSVDQGNDPADPDVKSHVEDPVDQVDDPADPDGDHGVGNGDVSDPKNCGNDDDGGESDPVDHVDDLSDPDYVIMTGKSGWNLDLDMDLDHNQQTEEVEKEEEHEAGNEKEDR